jgi:HK97 gp10 family phage protein
VGLKSRLPEIIGELSALADEIGRAAAELIMEDAKARVPVGDREPHLRDRIHIEHDEAVGWYVVAGDREAFYGHIVEHGSVNAAPQPFLVPAVEGNRGKIEELGRAAIRRGME